jgi:hypothetical protein
VPLSRNTRIVLVVVTLLAAVVCAAVALNIPEDAKLGAMVRFVMFHGASTWVNMLTFTLAGVFSAAFIAGVKGLGRWGEAFRWISLPMWAVNTVLGILSMEWLWGDILWTEPRLWMTFGLLAGSLIVLGVQLVVDHPKVPAALDGIIAVTLWVLVLFLPNLFHPDSPVFSSGNMGFIFGFFGMVEHLAIAVTAIAVLIARRAHPAHPHGHALP